MSDTDISDGVPLSVVTVQVKDIVAVLKRVRGVGVETHLVNLYKKSVVKISSLFFSEA